MIPTMIELDKALAHVLSAPKDNAQIEYLCHRPATGQREFVNQLEAKVKTGLAGDRWLKTPWLQLSDGTGDPRIQVCILQRRVLDLIWHENEEKGVFPGDTFIVDMDLGHENLPVGSMLLAGTAVLRVSSVFNNACSKWKQRYGQDALDWIRKPENAEYRLRGILCEIMADGVIELGSTLQKIPTTESTL